MSPNLISCQNKEHLIGLATTIISARLQEDINDHNTASLLLSGGSTPAPIYQSLSNIALPWGRVKIGMVDERWVDDGVDGSNAAMIRKTLLQGQASKAHFYPMKTPAKSAAVTVPDIETKYQTMRRPFSAIVLGMGLDGHTASWFAGADGYEQALDITNQKLVSAIIAKPSAVTGKHLERMTITAWAMMQTNCAILCLTGRDKRRVFEQALTANHSSINALPIQTAIKILGDRLTVLMCD